MASALLCATGMSRAVHFIFVAFALSATLFGPAGCHDGLGISSDAGDHTSPDLSEGNGKTCSGLSESACHARSDCAIDTCLECSCTPTFIDCRAVGDAPYVCPGLGCSQPECCHNDSDCSKGPSGPASACQVPPIDQGCGIICSPGGASTCQKDSDCTTAGQICASPRCSCSPVLNCVAGCASDGDCPEPQTCGTDFRCHSRACDSSCTGNYACDAGVCSRTACSSDSDCAVPGFCIDQKCSRSAGECVALAA